ncbi:MAG: cytochrome c [Kiloniellales bacterium]|nr:cytochrome c [Kiloniellales bacterium]
MNKLAAVLCIAAALGLSTQALAVDEPENVIKYRQAVMKAIGGHMASIASVVKGQVSYTDHVAGHANSINAMSKNVTAVFPKGTDNGSHKTAALPKIWEDWAGFEKAAQALDAASANLASVAASGDKQKLAAAFGDLGKACGGCHKPYRVKK